MNARQRVAEALAALDQLTRRLRSECPWDREQDERSIVPHTVEEAYELADAVQRGDDHGLRDELGDVLFQVHFLSLLLEERGAGDLAVVADGVRRKLIRRHPHVFGEVEVADAGEVLSNWDSIKRDEPDREPGIFGEVPENLPGLLYARKVQRRAATAGRLGPADDDASGPLKIVADRASALALELDAQARARAVGELLFSAVDAARRLHVDPELAVRAAADRFRSCHQAAGRAPDPAHPVDPADSSSTQASPISAPSPSPALGGPRR